MAVIHMSKGMLQGFYIAVQVGSIHYEGKTQSCIHYFSYIVFKKEQVFIMSFSLPLLWISSWTFSAVPRWCDMIDELETYSTHLDHHCCWRDVLWPWIIIITNFCFAIIGSITFIPHSVRCWFFTLLVTWAWRLLLEWSTIMVDCSGLD